MYLMLNRLIIKKKEAWLGLIFAALPFVLMITSILPTNFMQLSGESNSMSCMDFFQAVLSVQFNMVLPILGFFYLAVTCIHDEIRSGMLFVYKDISRTKILYTKILSLISWYGLFVVLTFISSVITYYAYIVNQTYASGLFLPTAVEDVMYIVINIVSVVCSSALGILLVTILSIVLNNGASLIIGMLFVLFSIIAPELEKINLIFPMGYLNNYETIGFGKSIVIVIILTLIYAGVFIWYGIKRMKRVEY